MLMGLQTVATAADIGIKGDGSRVALPCKLHPVSPTELWERIRLSRTSNNDLMIFMQPGCAIALVSIV